MRSRAGNRSAIVRTVRVRSQVVDVDETSVMDCRSV